jgi:hypothetical protein
VHALKPGMYIYGKGMWEYRRPINNKPVQPFNKLVYLKFIKALKDIYYTPPLTEEDEESLYAFYVKYSIKLDI